jgi:hypothetical protein
LELDARYSDIRGKTVYELIAERWNDENYNPVVRFMRISGDRKIVRYPTRLPTTMRDQEQRLVVDVEGRIR